MKEDANAKPARRPPPALPDDVRPVEQSVAVVEDVDAENASLHSAVFR